MRLVQMFDVLLYWNNLLGLLLGLILYILILVAYFKMSLAFSTAKL